MSTISNTTARQKRAGSSILGALAAVTKRLVAAFITWRLQQMALAHLRSMSDRELKDIGLTRSQIEYAVMGERAIDRVLSRNDWPIQPRRHNCMNVNIAHPPLSKGRGRVIALHCSGSGANQWGYLAETLGGGYEMLAPEHFGSERTGSWTGEHPFTLADEAARTITLMDACEDKIHLVGHSYGGGVALHVALAQPERIASMALYEPSAFYLLRQMHGEGVEALAEITSIARRTCEGVVTGDYRAVASAFVNYWNGPGAWDALRPAAQAALIRWSPKAALEFRALIEEPTPASACQTLSCPVLILRGEHAPLPSRVIAEGLSKLLPGSRLLIVDGAGHMGPLTHAPEVSGLIVQHIATAAVASAASSSVRWRPRSLAGILGVASRTKKAAS